MSTESDDSSIKDEAEYRKQVLDRFGARSKSLTKQFSILLIFVCGFLAFIIVPMGFLNYDADQIDAQLARLENLMKERDALKNRQRELQSEIDLMNGEITSFQSVLDKKQQEAKETGLKKKDIEDDLKLTGERGDKIMSERMALNDAQARLSETLSSFAPDERVRELRSWLQEMSSSADLRDACDENPDPSFYSCMVRQKLRGDWDRDFQRIQDEVVVPLREVDPEASQKIEEKILEVRTFFQASLDEDPNFWRTVNEKLIFMDKLFDSFSAAFGEISTIVKTRETATVNLIAKLKAEEDELSREQESLEDQRSAIDTELAEIQKVKEEKNAALADKRAQQDRTRAADRKLVDQLKTVQSELQDLLDRKEANKKEREEIAERLKSLQSPFGTLPIGLKEAVLVFPLILAAGFLVCAIILSDLIRLRGEYRNSMGRGGGLDSEVIERRLATIVPLWFDPADGVLNRVALRLLLLALFTIFAATAWLVTNDWLLRLGGGESANMLRLAYAFFYLVGGGLFGIGFLNVFNRSRAPRSAAQ